MLTPYRFCHRARAPLALASLLALSAACGARTPLEAPDVDADNQTDGAFDGNAGDGAPAGDASDVPAAPPICVLPGGPLVNVDLQTDPVVTVADVLFVLDRTGSMQGEIDNIRDSLRTVIIPGLVHTIRDLRVGLVTFADFPVGDYGERGDVPFTLERPMTDQPAALQGALDPIRAEGGNDNPEALVEALYQIATGEGIRAPDTTGSFNNHYIPPSEGCPMLGVGYACIRPRSVPIVLVMTDAPTHNGRASDGTVTNAYNSAYFPAQYPHTYAQAVSAIRTSLNARIIGINSGDGITTTARPDLELLASDTGAVGADGRPLVFDINQDGSGLGDQVVTAVQRFTAEVRFDVSATVFDLDGGAGSALVRGVVPQRADPASQVARFDATTFYSVVPGTHLYFSLQLDPARARPMAADQLFHLRVDFLADRRSVVGTHDLTVLIPGTGHSCPSIP